jgi:hypothetical protein
VSAPGHQGGGGAQLETEYCAQVLAVTYRAMGLLPGGRRPGRCDPGSFWSGDNLGLPAGFRLGGEIAVHLPDGDTVAPRTPPVSANPQLPSREAISRQADAREPPFWRNSRHTAATVSHVQIRVICMPVSLVGKAD